MRDLLHTNGGCQLPCWWGITPGRTNAISAAQQLKSYGGPIFPMPGQPQKKEYEIYVELQPQKNGTVRSLSISSEVPGRIEGTSLVQDWQLYSLAQILTTFGRPSEVLLELSNACYDPPCGTSGYGLYVLYEHLGILIVYLGPAERNNPIRLCPVFANVGYLEITLQSPEDTRSLFETAKIPQEEIQKYIKPLAEVTDMTIDDFYRIFKEPADTTCIVSPARHWEK